MTVTTDVPRQPSLFDPAELPGMREPLYSPEMTLGDRFEAFHAANPHVYDALRQLALDLVQRGRRRLGIDMLTEVLRWQRLVVTHGDEYKINNNYRPYYARLLMARESALAGIFETRKAQADE